MKKYLILLSGLVACTGLSAQEKVVYQGMTMVVETAIIGTVVKFRHYESIGRLSR